MQHSKARFTALVAVLVLETGAHAQTTWYVDVNGTPPGTGTPTDPYTSLQYALDRPTTLDLHTLRVGPGTYRENVTIQKSVYVIATAGALQTKIEPLAAGRVLLLDFDVTAQVIGFTVSGGFGPSGDGVVMRAGGLLRSIVRDNSRNGVSVDYDGWVADCTIVNNASAGFWVQPVAGAGSISGSLLWQNGTVDAGSPAAGFISVSYCAGLSGWISGGTGNVYGDPGLWDLPQGDLHLAPFSPCINAGNPALPLDPDGSRRDIGALVYDALYAPAPSTYCTGKTNSQGCVPAIGAIGTASASAATPFTISAVNIVENRPGLLLFGLAPQAQAFQGGWLCIQPPLKRVGAQNSGSSGVPCSGVYAFDMKAYVQSGAHPGLVPGEIGYCEWWGRDPLDPAGFGSSLSDALSFGIAP